MNGLEHTAWNIFRPIALRYVVSILKRELLVTRSVAEWVDFACRFHEKLSLPRRVRNQFSIAPSQVRFEILRLLLVLKELKPVRVLEIGTANGGTLFLFARVTTPDATMISIDLAPRPEGGGFPSWRTPLYLAFATAWQKVHLIRADSHSWTTVDDVETLLQNKKLDVLFIDGDHKYSGIMQDFEMYSPLVRSGGLVVFHDIVPDHKTRYGTETSSHAGEVYRFWNEIRNEYKGLEIVDNPKQDGFGIGIISLGDDTGTPKFL